MERGDDDDRYATVATAHRPQPFTFRAKGVTHTAGGTERQNVD